MVQPITNYGEFFANAKKAIADANSLQEAEEKLKEQEASLANSIQSEQKALKDAIEMTVEKRKNELTSSYDKEISKAQDELKKEQAKREKAKNRGVKERIKEETGGLISANREMKTNMKKAFAKQKVPAFCRTRLYYALYFPHHFSEWLTTIIYILVFFIAVPFAIYHFLLPHKSLYLYLIYAADVMLFGGLYIAIGNATKNKHMDMLREGRNIFDQIDVNLRQIRQITNGIKKDRNDSKYNLGAFDDEIAHINQRLADASTKKQDALNTFNTVTKNIISDELTGNAKPRIDELTASHADTLNKLREASIRRQQAALSLTDNYEVYLGKEFLKADRIDALQKIMQRGTAANLSEAIEEYKNREEG